MRNTYNKVGFMARIKWIILWKYICKQCKAYKKSWEGTMRVGTGYDVHKLVEGRDLILGGVKIPYEKGLLGHSDADVLVHAIMDAMLGAAALGDIGKHFPDTDPAYKGISSIHLLKKVGDLLSEKGYVVINIDSTIIAQKPKLAAYIPEMISNIAKALKISEDHVNVKATTEEGLGFTGEGLGIAAQGVCLLDEIGNFAASDVMYQYSSDPGHCEGCCCSKGCMKK